MEVPGGGRFGTGSGLTRELARLGWAKSSDAGSSGSAGRSGGWKFRALARSFGLSRVLTPVSSSTVLGSES